MRLLLAVFAELPLNVTALDYLLSCHGVSLLLVMSTEPPLNVTATDCMDRAIIKYDCS